MNMMSNIVRPGLREGAGPEGPSRQQSKQTPGLPETTEPRDERNGMDIGQTILVATDPPIQAEPGAGDQPPQVRLPDPAVPVRETTVLCGYCDRAFSTKSGLGLHELRAHMTERNVRICARDNQKTKKRWGEEEEWYCALLEFQFHTDSSISGKTVNEYITAELRTGRTMDAVKGQRRKPKHRQAVLDLTAEADSEKVRERSFERGAEDREEVRKSQGAAWEDLMAAHLLKHRGDIAGVIGTDDLGNLTLPGLAELGDAWENWLGLKVKSQRDVNPARGLIRKRKKAVNGGPCTSGRRPHPRLGQTKNDSASNTLPSQRLRSQAKAKARWSVQHAWRKSPSDTVRRILKGEFGSVESEDGTRETSPAIGIPGLEEFWGKSFGVESAPDARRVDVQLVLWDLCLPITLEEVETAIKLMKDNSPGADGIKKADIVRCPLKGLVLWYNIWLYSGGPPASLCGSSVSMIPKVATPVSPSDFRPICISSKVLRLFHSVLSKRFRAVDLPEQQRGFRPMDGCFENVWLLRGLLNTSRKEMKPISLAFVDVANAFGSVSHSSLLRATELVGVPGPLLRYIASVYSSTSIGFKGGSQKRWPVKRGVHQGDPLSPDLFNFVMAMVCKDLDPRVGFRYGDGEKVCSYACYADDTVLFAEGKIGIKSQFAAFESSMGKTGMKLNAKKCSTLTIGISGADKKFYIDGEPFLGVEGSKVSALTLDATYKYLGVRIGPGGIEFDPVRSEMRKRLAMLQATGLNPQQKLVALKNFVMPGYLHQLVLGGFRRGKLAALDIDIRHETRRLLHLPHDVPLAFFYAKCRDGGLGLSCWERDVLRSRRERTLKLRSSSNACLQYLVSRSVVGKNMCDQEQTEFTHWLSDQTITGKNMQSEEWRALLYRSVDGTGLAQHTTTPLSSRWLSNPEELPMMKGQEFLRAIHVRAACLKTPMRASRGNVGAKRNCTTCTDQLCALSHILQICPKSQGMRIERHNNLCKWIAGAVKAKGWSVQMEPRIPSGRTYLKPDMVFVKGRRVIVVDPTVVADKFDMSMAYTLKHSKYDNSAVDSYCRDLTVQCDGPYLLTVIPFVVNWRGAVYPKSWRELQTNFKLSRTWLSLAVLKVLCDGWKIWHAITAGRTR
jgi:hypothetical protein